jgi:hypothetical protein
MRLNALATGPAPLDPNLFHEINVMLAGKYQRTIPAPAV